MNSYFQKSYIYLICDAAQNLYKIGVTKNIHGRRLKQLQTGNGTELHLVTYHETFYPYRLEKMLHGFFSNKRQHGEWFALEDKDVIDFKDTCNKMEETIEILKENPFFAKNLR